jgi:hypothetical protein
LDKNPYNFSVNRHLHNQPPSAHYKTLTRAARFGKVLDAKGLSSFLPVNNVHSGAFVLLFSNACAAGKDIPAARSAKTIPAARDVRGHDTSTLMEKPRWHNLV